MTAEEFEMAYAARSGIPVQALREHRTVRPCDCREEGCEGWQSISFERATEMDLAEAVRLLREYGSCDPYSGQPYDDVVAFLARVDAGS